MKHLKHVKVGFNDIAAAADEMLFFILRCDVKGVGDFSDFTRERFGEFTESIDEFIDLTQPNFAVRLRTSIVEPEKAMAFRNYQIGCSRRSDGFECLILDMNEKSNPSTLRWSKNERYTTYEASLIVPKIADGLPNYKNVGHPGYLLRELPVTKDGSLYCIERELRALAGLKSE